MYKVIHYFTDLQDDNYAYRVGDIYPREGITVTSARINDLLSGSNRRGLQLIEEIKKESPTGAEVARTAEKATEKKTARTKKKTKEG